MSGNGREPDKPGDSKSLLSTWDPVTLPCKNTFFEIPDVGDVASSALGPATCPPPTEGWWSSPSPSRGRSEASPNPLDDIGPTPDWSPPPHTLPGVAAPPSNLRFDRMLVEATTEDDEAEDDVTDEKDIMTRASSTSLSKGGAGGLSTPWEDQPHFAPQRSRDTNIRLPPPHPPPEKPCRFDLLLQQANDEEISSVEASRRSSMASGAAVEIPDTPWEGTSGLDTPWEEQPPAPHAPPPHDGLPGFSSWPKPLLSTGPSASGYVGGPLPSSSSVGMRGGGNDLPHAVGEPARLPSSTLDQQPFPAVGPLLSVPPPLAQMAPVGPPAGGRLLSLAASLGFGATAAPVSQNGSPEKAKARRRRGSKEAKNPDHNKDDKWWLPTSTFVDLGGLVKVSKESPVPVAIAA